MMTNRDHQEEIPELQELPAMDRYTEAVTLGTLAITSTHGAGEGLKFFTEQTDRMQASQRQEMLKKQRLPIRFQDRGSIQDTESAAKRLGIELGTRYDVFYEVKLPEGWQIKATERSLWSNLLDDKGAVRGSIFYKSSFGYTEAFWRLHNRYYTTSKYVDSTGAEVSYDEHTHKVAVVVDAKTNGIAHKEPATLRRDWDAENEADAAALAWLTKTFPDHKDPIAYWEDA